MLTATNMRSYIPDDSKEKQSMKSPFDKFSAHQTYQPEHCAIVKVVKKSNRSLVCLFGEGNSIKGFMSALDPQYRLDYSLYEEISEDNQMECEIIGYDYDHKSFQLRYIRRIE